MHSLKTGVVAVLLLVPVIGCGPRPLGSQTQESISRLAVIVRVAEDVQVRVERGVTLPPDAEDRLTTVLGERTSPFILESGIHQGFVDALGDLRTWTVVPSLEVASALGSLLAREETPRYDRLESIRVDTVLEVRVPSWGVSAREAGIGGFCGLEARLLRLDRGRVVWRGRIRLDRAAVDGGPDVTLQDLLDGEPAAIEALVADLVSAAGRELASAMGLTGAD